MNSGVWPPVCSTHVGICAATLQQHPDDLVVPEGGSDYQRSAAHLMSVVRSSTSAPTSTNIALFPAAAKTCIV